jgi:hypothetical protein
MIPFCNAQIHVLIGVPRYKVFAHWRPYQNYVNRQVLTEKEEQKPGNGTSEMFIIAGLDCSPRTLTILAQQIPCKRVQGTSDEQTAVDNNVDDPSLRNHWKMPLMMHMKARNV